jgi:hypothetical protein
MVAVPVKSDKIRRGVLEQKRCPALSIQSYYMPADLPMRVGERAAPQGFRKQLGTQANSKYNFAGGKSLGQKCLFRPQPSVNLFVPGMLGPTHYHQPVESIDRGQFFIIAEVNLVDAVPSFSRPEGDVGAGKILRIMFD